MGTRIGADGNKAYLPLAGRAMVTWSLATMASVSEIGRIVLVHRRGERELAERTVAAEVPDLPIAFAEGGDSRHASEVNVLQSLAPDIESGAIDVVVIHDAARPLAGADMMRTAVRIARESGGAVPAITAPDVVRTTSERVELLDGNTLVRVQTPQAFRSAPLLAAYRAAETENFEGTDTSSCVEQFTDLQIRTFSGAAENLKVTYARDVAVAEWLLRQRDQSSSGKR